MTSLKDPPDIDIFISHDPQRSVQLLLKGREAATRELTDEDVERFEADPAFIDAMISEDPRQLAAYFFPDVELDG